MREVVGSPFAQVDLQVVPNRVHHFKQRVEVGELRCRTAIAPLPEPGPWIGGASSVCLESSAVAIRASARSRRVERLSPVRCAINWRIFAASVRICWELMSGWHQS